MVAVVVSDAGGAVSETTVVVFCGGVVVLCGEAAAVVGCLEEMTERWFLLALAAGTGLVVRLSMGV